jgi:nitroreductase
MDLMEAIKQRRSIRKYKLDAVPDEVLGRVLEAVQWAPSWANTQCWEVIVVKDPNIKSGLAATLPKGNPAIAAIAEAPLVIALCAKKGVSGFYKGQVTTDKGDWFMFDMGLAMQNLCLSAHAEGLGTVVVGLMDHKKAAEILRLPNTVEVVAMTPLGYPAAAGGVPKRREISDFVSHERFGNK